MCVCLSSLKCTNVTSPPVLKLLDSFCISVIPSKYCHFIYLSSWIAPVPSHTRRSRKLASYLRVNCKNILVCAEQKSCLLQVFPPFFSDNFLDIFHYFVRLSRIRHSHSSYSGNIDFFTSYLAKCSILNLIGMKGTSGSVRNWIKNVTW